MNKQTKKHVGYLSDVESYTSSLRRAKENSARDKEVDL